MTSLFSHLFFSKNFLIKPDILTHVILRVINLHKFIDPRIRPRIYIHTYIRMRFDFKDYLITWAKIICLFIYIYWHFTRILNTYDNNIICARSKSNFFKLVLQNLFFFFSILIHSKLSHWHVQRKENYLCKQNL